MKTPRTTSTREAGFRPTREAGFRPTREAGFRPTREAGFSMVEMLVTLVILGVGLLGLAAMQATNLRGASSSRQRDTAAYLANNILENLEAHGRMSDLIKTAGQTVPSTNAFAAYVDNAAVNWQQRNGSGSLTTNFAIDGQPVDATLRPTLGAVFTAHYVIRAAKAGSPVAATVTNGREVVVNVTWNEVVKNSSGASVTQAKWLSMSRFIRF